eukprot:15341948-Ditylum_brightwellii.AAC.1
MGMMMKKKTATVEDNSAAENGASNLTTTSLVAKDENNNNSTLLPRFALDLEEENYSYHHDTALSLQLPEGGVNLTLLTTVPVQTLQDVGALKASNVVRDLLSLHSEIGEFRRGNIRVQMERVTRLCKPKNELITKLCIQHIDVKFAKLGGSLIRTDDVIEIVNSGWKNSRIRTFKHFLYMKNILLSTNDPLLYSILQLLLEDVLLLEEKNVFG